VPNNALPLIIRRAALPPGRDDPAATFEKVFGEQGWGNSWRDGVFDFHHYHSTSHEVLGVAKGEAVVRFGGENGRDISLAAGDVVVIPAGVGHKRQYASRDFETVGAYPGGRDYDIIKAADSTPAVHAAAKARIVSLELPQTDPIDGADGPLLTLWTAT
jgi:uncharacterized protein YjlB